MLIIDAKKYTLVMSSKLMEAYNELKNAKDLGVVLVKNDSLVGISLFDNNNNRIGCIFGESGMIIKTLFKKEDNIDRIISSLKDTFSMNNTIMNNGNFVRKTNDYTKDVE